MLFSRSMQRFFYALIIFIGFSSNAQFHEFGGGFGGAAYTGDINPRFRPFNIRPAFQLFYRLNVSKTMAFKLSANGGFLSGSEKFSSDPLPEVRKATFTSSYGALAFSAEYNFINFRDRKTPIRISPYLSGGLSLFSTGPAVTGSYVSENLESEFFSVAIPFGGGVKYRLSKVMNLGWEALAFKTFNDHIDGISRGVISDHITADPNDFDWFYQTVFTVSYTIYGIKCPGDQKYTD